MLTGIAGIAAMGVDKLLAVMGWDRISERTLHIIALLGGFWGIILATLFLGLGWGGKMLITAIVFLADPGWFHRAAEVHWPDTTFKNFVAIALLALIATRPRASRRWEHHRRRARY